jgi:hypothetical protein
VINHCPDHTRVEIERAVLTEQLAQARAVDAVTATALDRLDQRLSVIERRLAIWGGVVAALAAIPLVEKLVNLFIPAARAAIGG